MQKRIRQANFKSSLDIYCVKFCTLLTCAKFTCEIYLTSPYGVAGKLNKYFTQCLGLSLVLKER